MDSYEQAFDELVENNLSDLKDYDVILRKSILKQRIKRTLVGLVMASSFVASMVWAHSDSIKDIGEVDKITEEINASKASGATQDAILTDKLSALPEDCKSAVTSFLSSGPNSVISDFEAESFLNQRELCQDEEFGIVGSIRQAEADGEYYKHRAEQLQQDAVLNAEDVHSNDEYLMGVLIGSFAMVAVMYVSYGKLD